MGLMAYDERRILEMLREDEVSRRRAFEAIVRNFSEQLYWQIRHMVLDHDDANDIARDECRKTYQTLLFHHQMAYHVGALCCHRACKDEG